MPSSGEAWAVIVAAGRGERFGSPKQFAPLAGKPLALWAIEAFRGHPNISGVSVVVAPEAAKAPPDWLRRLQATGIRVVAGGPRRVDSVRLGLASVPVEVALVAVHDGARPAISAESIGRVVRQAGPQLGAIAARPVTDSLKAADDRGRVARSVSRERLWRAETPQVFPRALIIEAHGRAEAERIDASDCATLFERYGWEVALVEISDPNPKVTRPEDLPLVEALLSQRGPTGEAADA